MGFDLKTKLEEQIERVNRKIKELELTSNEIDLLMSAEQTYNGLLTQYWMMFLQGKNNHEDYN